MQRGYSLAIRSFGRAAFDSHPGGAIVEAAQERALPLSPADDFEEIFGKGVRGRVPVVRGKQRPEQTSIVNDCLPQDSLNGDTDTNNRIVDVAVSNRTFMMHLGIPLSWALLEEREQRAAVGQICSFVAVNGEVAGLIVLEDVPRAEVARLSVDLKREGIKQTVLLTGDGEVVARLDAPGNPSERTLLLVYLNSFYETGIKSPLDTAILQYASHASQDVQAYRKSGEIPFDFERRRLSMVVEKDGSALLISNRNFASHFSHCDATVIIAGNP
jgi:hypothetical protein